MALQVYWQPFSRLRSRLGFSLFCGMKQHLIMNVSVALFTPALKFNQPRKLVSNCFWVILFPFSCMILPMCLCSKGHTHDEEIVWLFRNAQEGIFSTSCKLPSASTIFTCPLLHLHLYFIFHQSSMVDSCNPLSPSLYRSLENSILAIGLQPPAKTLWFQIPVKTDTLLHFPYRCPL